MKTQLPALLVLSLLAAVVAVSGCVMPPACLPHAEYRCYNGNVYWYDSCGNAQTIRESCSAGCSGSSCLPQANMKFERFWTDKSTYSVGDKVHFFAKLSDNNGNPVTPDNGSTSVKLYVSSAPTQISSSSYTDMPYNPASGYYEYSTPQITDASLSTGIYVFYANAKNQDGGAVSDKAYITVKQNPSNSTNSTCTDSDGGKNYYVKGVTSGISPSTGQYYSGEDICGFSGSSYAKEGQLVEHYCDGMFHTNTIYTCPNGCSDGACINECTDGDAFSVPNAIYTKANCTDMNGTHLDYCKNSTVLVDYSCGGNSIQGPFSCVDGWVTCPNGCSDGACISANCTAVGFSEFQVPAGGWALNDKGVLSLQLINMAGHRIKISKLQITYANSTITFNESAGNEAPGGAYVASITGLPKYPAGTSYSVNVTVIYTNPDSFGVIEGSISTGTLACVVVGQALCSDSDGGINYYLKGTVQRYNADGSATAFVDSCGYDRILEYFCNGDQVQNISYQCPNGCADGVCLSANTSCTSSLNCSSQMKCENFTCVPVGCLQEGQTGPSSGINPVWLDHLAKDCCSGLTPITYSGLYDSNCSFLPIAGGPSGVCTKCGDGICGNGETKCNCPQDCGSGPITISGYVRTSASMPVSGVTVTTVARTSTGSCPIGPVAQGSGVTNSQGFYSYSFPKISPSDYCNYVATTPSKSGCTFSPANATIAYSGSNISMIFNATCSPPGPPVPPVSCTDTDGGPNYTVKGVCTDATGSYADRAGTTINNSVREYYCGPTSWPAINQTCMWGETACLVFGVNYSSIDGACVQACTDTDGGKNFYVKSNTTNILRSDGTTFSWEDICVKDNYGNSSLTYNFLFEGYCDGQYGKILQGPDLAYCPNGCANGACLGSPSTQCSAGWICQPGGYYRGYLAANCSWLASEYCTQGCSNGTCLPAPSQTCNDSDGGLNYYVKGTASSISSSGVTIYSQGDTCAVSQGGQMITGYASCSGSNCYVREGYCSGTIASYQDYNCANGCLNGACNP